MKSRDNAVRLKKFQIEDKRRQVGQIETMIEEFTRMILAQRGFQASSRTITVADELLLETLNLKR